MPTLKLVAIAIASLTLLQTGNAQQTSHRLTLRINNVEWSIVAKVKPVTIYSTWTGELIRYTVRRKGVFAHCISHEDAGRLMGRRTHKRGPSAFSLSPFPVKNPRGWRIVTFSRLGNTSGLRSQIILPSLHGDDDELIRPRYSQTRIDHKFELIERPTKNGVEIWGAYQEWGNGGTSGSAYVPFCKVLKHNGEFVRKTLPSDLTTWPLKQLNEQHAASFVGIFVAGFREHSPLVMQAALDNRFKGCEVWCKSFGLPDTRKGLQGLIDDTRRFLEIRERLEARLPQGILKDSVD